MDVGCLVVVHGVEVVVSVEGAGDGGFGGEVGEAVDGGDVGFIFWG